MPVDTEGNVVTAGDIRGLTRQTFEEILAVLAEAGASLDDIVDLTSSHIDLADPGGSMEVKGPI
jgi:enamine deaminase RidA (YjgF/YER057c/UK114 family)